MIPEEVRQQAIREVTHEIFRKKVDAEKLRIRKYRSFWHWLPFTITITWKKP